MPPKATAGAVLLALLEYTDSSTLEVLIGAENLLRLLRHEGWSDEQIKQAFKREGKLPGELLLGLFRGGKKPAELLAVLGPVAAAEVAAGRAKAALRDSAEHAPSTPRSGAPAYSGVPPTPRSGAPGRASPSEDLARRAVTERLRRPRPRPRGSSASPAGALEQTGLMVTLVAAIAPGLLSIIDLSIALAFLRIGPWVVAGAAALLGAIGGALFARGTRRWWAGPLGGALAAFGGNVAVVGYAFGGLAAGREHILRLEIALAALVGVVPGGLLYAALARAGRRAG